jgi:RHS repeat-associated protein
VNRICSWVRAIDRDGDLMYFGVNYLGQALVEAVKDRESDHYTFVERLFNADGNLLQLRRPTSGASAWNAGDGYTAYRYDEIDPAANDGWNGWLPVFWSRRANVLRIETYSTGFGVIDIDEQTGRATTSLGRFQRFVYEPLFNQVRAMTLGAIELRPGPGKGIALVPTDIPYETVDVVFDYQELSWTAPASAPQSIVPVLRSLERWGFDWLRDAAGDYDIDAIRSWQLTLPLLDTDLNGDGIQGFDESPAVVARARGVPLVVHRRSQRGSPADATVRLVWAPHGQPAGIIGPDGATWIFEYFSDDPGASAREKYGDTNRPVDADVDQGYRGLLGRIRAIRLPGQYPAAFGPPEPASTKFPGPYQWTVADGAAGSLEEALNESGIPAPVVDALLESATDAGRMVERAFSYTETGALRYIWDETGTAWLERDTDGREVTVTDQAGRVTRTTRSLDGFPTNVRTFDAAGNQIGEIYREFDEEGRITYECQALSAGGCDPYGSPRPTDGVLTRYQYTPEGQLAIRVDPEGLRNEYTYDADKRLRVTRSWLTTLPADVRSTRYTYTRDGDLAERATGDLDGTSGAVLRETYRYDGLRRLRTSRDRRGLLWQHAYSCRDLLTRRKRDNVPYGTPGGAAPSWEVSWAYDATGRLTESSVNGTLTRTAAYTQRGLPFAEWELGSGTTYTTYDLLGNPVFRRDPRGFDVIYTWRDTPRQTAETTVRRGSEGAVIATASVIDIDSRGHATRETRHGGAISIPVDWVRDANGFILTERGADGFVCTYERNWVGWATSTTVRRDPRPADPGDITRYTYDKLGQVVSITDPAGQQTDIDFTPFGEVKARRTPGSTAVTSGYLYDALGRLLMKRVGATRTRVDYDQRGDATAEWVEDLGGPLPLARRAYDDLGRLVETIDFNNAVSWLPDEDRTVRQRFAYDRLGRLARQETQIGRLPAQVLVTNWILAGDAWQRIVSYRHAGAWSGCVDAFDNTGRLASQTRTTAGQAGSSTFFHWFADRYIGRTQQLPGRPSPFREHRALDPFAVPDRWTYTAIDVDAAAAPFNTAEGEQFCGGPWNATECSRPLLNRFTRRDTAGRLVSEQWQFGHPSVVNGHLAARTVATPWRGYEYTLRRHLAALFEHAGVGAPPDSAALRSYFVSSTEVRQLAAAATQWVYERERNVGSVESIAAPLTNARRWRTTQPRDRGHQLRTFELDGVTHSVSHDASGRVTSDGVLTFVYDARDRLAMTLRGGFAVEVFAYDDFGRLTAILPGPLQPADTLILINDGRQIVAALGGAANLRWEAAWGPHLDQLIEWHDVEGGTGRHVPLLDDRYSVVGALSVREGRLVEMAEYTPEGRLTLRDALDAVICTETALGDRCDAPVGVPFAYLSAWRSPETGLIFLRNRWYHPAIGQWLSHDPLGFIDSSNLYAYAAFDPINNVDRLGLTSDGPADLGSGGSVTDSFPDNGGGGNQVPKPDKKVKPKPDPRSLIGIGPLLLTPTRPGAATQKDLDKRKKWEEQKKDPKNYKWFDLNTGQPSKPPTEVGPDAFELKWREKQRDDRPVELGEPEIRYVPPGAEPRPDAGASPDAGTPRGPSGSAPGSAPGGAPATPGQLPAAPGRLGYLPQILDILIDAGVLPPDAGVAIQGGKSGFIGSALKGSTDAGTNPRPPIPDR